MTRIINQYIKGFKFVLHIHDNNVCTVNIETDNNFEMMYKGIYDSSINMILTKIADGLKIEADSKKSKQ